MLRTEKEEMGQGRPPESHFTPLLRLRRPLVCFHQNKLGGSRQSIGRSLTGHTTARRLDILGKMGSWTRWTFTLCLLWLTQAAHGNHFHQERERHGHEHYYYDLESESETVGRDMDKEEQGHGHGQEVDKAGYEHVHDHGASGGHEFPLDEEPIRSGDEDEEAPLHLVTDIDPASPAISLTAEPGFNGAELFFDGSGLSLPRPFTAKSHRFKGGVNWTIYPGTNYTGNPICLVADPRHHVTLNANHQVQVGSVRRGCWCNESMMVTPRPRSQGSVTSGVQIWSGRNAEGSWAYTDGRETRFPYPLDMVSFQLLGTWIPWTVFGGADLSGDSSCLVAAADRDGGSGSANYVFTNIPRPFRVASVQQACVASSSFEFAGVDKGVEGGRKEQKGKLLDNEIPVIPPGVSPVPGGGGGAGGGPGGDGPDGGQGSEVGGQSGIPGSETADTESGKVKAKERNGKAGTGAASYFATFGISVATAAVLVVFGRN